MKDEKNTMDFEALEAALRERIEVPDLVQQRMLRTLDSIKEAERKPIQLPNMPERVETAAKSKRITKKKLGVILIAAALAVGGGSVAAEVYRKAQEAPETGKVLLGEKAEYNGITVTAMENIVDNYYALLRFKVEGYELEGTAQPYFEECRVVIDGCDPARVNVNDDYKSWWEFDNGIVTAPDNSRVRESDGASLEELRSREGTPPNLYVREDGSLELEIGIRTPRKKGKLFGKPVHIELKNLGTAGKAEFIYDEKGAGIWEFDGALSGAGAVREINPDAAIGDTGIKVLKAELSPISLTVYYDRPLFEIKATPKLLGVKLKDGTLYPRLWAGPGMDVTPPKRVGDDYACLALERILEVNQIEALLFEKEKPGEGAPYTEENMYVVPIE